MKITIKILSYLFGFILFFSGTFSAFVGSFHYLANDEALVSFFSEIPPDRTWLFSLLLISSGTFTATTLARKFFDSTKKTINQ